MSKFKLFIALFIAVTSSQVYSISLAEVWISDTKNQVTSFLDTHSKNLTSNFAAGFFGTGLITTAFGFRKPVVLAFASLVSIAACARCLVNHHPEKVESATNYAQAAFDSLTKK